ncbi:MAG: hypothetical protein IIA73_07525 [Proteobacteria bacterium]|nr:hypothetical protein [Pseudomonadota bacterium]
MSMYSFRACAAAETPYDRGGAAEQIVATLKHFPLDNIIRKTFYDLPGEFVSAA